MGKEMLEYNQNLMDQAKQMISGGKYKKKTTNPKPKRKTPAKVQIRQKSKLSKRADFLITLSVIIVMAHIFLGYLTYETVKTPSANGHGGFAEFLAFIVVPILFLAWIIESFTFITFLLLCRKQGKSPKTALRVEAKNERKAADIAVLISFVSTVAFWVFWWIALNIASAK